MKITEEVGGKLLEALNKVTVGGYIEFYSPWPGLTDERVAVMLTKRNQKAESNVEWEFDMFWFDVFIGKASARLLGQDLTFSEVA